MPMPRIISMSLLGALLLATSACSEDPTAASSSSGTGTSAFGSGTIPRASTVAGGASLLSTDEAVFGTGNVLRPDAAAKTNDAGIGTDSGTVEQALAARGTITINGLKPSLYGGDARWVQRANMVKLIPRNNYLATGLMRFNGEGLLNFGDLMPNNYHMVIKDDPAKLPLVSQMLIDSDRKFHIGMVGFYVTPESMIQVNLRQGNNPFPLSADLYWDTQSFPCEQSPPFTDPDPLRPHHFGEFYTYEDEFKVKARVFDPAFPQAEYRFVVYGADSLWFSTWHTPDADGFVRVKWNGYSCVGTGAKDMPDETAFGNSLLSEGSYKYGIQFKQKGCRFPDDAPVLANADDLPQYRNGGFISTFYGASQLASFVLRHGIKPASASVPATSSAGASF